MERRVLLAIFLSFLVLYVYQALIVKPKPGDALPNAANSSTTAAAPSTTATAESATAAATTPGSANPATTTPPTAAPDPSTSPAAKPEVADTAERDIRIENADVVATFTNRGARLKSWKLKKYFDHRRQPQELVEQLPNQPLPFTLKTADAAVNGTITNALYTVSGEPTGSTPAPIDLRFEYRDSSGVSVVKEFHLEPTFYVMTFRATVRSGGAEVPATVQWGPGIGDTGVGTIYGAQKAQGLIAESSNVKRIAAKDIAKQSTYDGDFKYVGVDDNYFMSVALQPGPVKVSYEHLTIPDPANPKAPRELTAYSLEAHQAAPPLKYFIGPKDFDVLAALGPDMTRAINFGMFSVIVVPLLRSLKWVHTYVGNWGWSIVVLTVIINIVLFPLQHKSIVSMRKMQEIQPQMKAIQDRYAKFKATDPEKQKMNQELMALYKERGVNPASGCVPMLLTMPLLLAMWAMLQTSIELRGAPFMGWIHDLTAADPYYVTPVLMGLTQFWQQKITPTAGADPAQQKMMMMMPAIMTVMFLWLPAGALIYYTVSGVLRIGQQYLTNSIIGPPKIRNVRPAAERRVKRAGGEKSDA
jgi:YidC/Oxa1 family membrane protein insertase